MAERDRAWQRVDELRIEADLERSEADEWAGTGFLQLVYRLFGRLDERRDLESSQALAAATRLATAQSALDELERSLAEARTKVPATVDVGAALESLRNAWARVDPDGYAGVIELEQQSAAAAALLKEYDEAIEAVHRCQEAAAVAEQRLSSARAWGTYDLLGGGLLASAVKRQRVSDALSAIESTTSGIAAVRRELADIPTSVAVPAGLEMGSGAWAFDVWFDNIFSDLNMQARIREAADKVVALRDTLDTTRAQLDTARAQAARDAAYAAARVATAFTAP